MEKEVVIIKGNPKYIKENPLALNFYNEIKEYCEQLNAKVSFDSGEPFTVPKPAYLWIGHSRGCDRLRFAPEGTKILALGSFINDAINDPRDNTIKFYGKNETIPNEFHYSFTENMKKAIKKILE